MPSGKVFTVPKITPKFQPKPGETYRFIGVPVTKFGNLSLLIGRRVWRGNNADKARAALGNVFASLKEAKTVRTAILDALKSANR